MTLSLKALAAAVCLAATVPAAASASTFIGDDATFDIAAAGGASLGNTTTTIGSGAELTVFGASGAFISADIGASTLTVIFDIVNLSFVGFNTNIAVSGLQATDGATVSGASLASGNALLVRSVVTTNSSITVQIADLVPAVTGGVNTFVFNIATSPATGVTTPVPLPAGLPLALGGLAVLGLVRRTRRAA
jgi:hypothetical protein